MAGGPHPESGGVPLPAWARAGYLAAGFLLVALGVIGAFLPVMPTTIFLILAAGAFARSSPRLEAWLVNHPRLGPSIVAWREHGAIPPRAKVLSIGMMGVSALLMALSAAPLVAKMAADACLAAAAIYVATRPSGPAA